jgi:hypothetical protein
LMVMMIAHRQPIIELPLVLAARSTLAPPIFEDPHSLTRRRWRCRTAQWRNFYLLVRRGILSPIWLPPLMVCSILLWVRRCILDAGVFLGRVIRSIFSRGPF